MALCLIKAAFARLGLIELQCTITFILLSIQNFSDAFFLLNLYLTNSVKKDFT